MKDVMKHPIVVPILEGIRQEFKSVVDAMMANPDRAKAILDDFRDQHDLPVTFPCLSAASGHSLNVLTNTYVGWESKGTQRSPSWPTVTVQQHVILRLAEKVEMLAAANSQDPEVPRLKRHIERLVDQCDSFQREADRQRAFAETRQRALVEMTDRYRVAKAQLDDIQRRTVEDHEGVIWSDKEDHVDPFTRIIVWIKRLFQ